MFYERKVGFMNRKRTNRLVAIFNILAVATFYIFVFSANAYSIPTVLFIVTTFSTNPCFDDWWRWWKICIW